MDSQKEKSELFYKDGIFCLRLSGTPYEIGYQQGTLLKSQIKNGIYKYFSDYLIGIVKNDKRVKIEPLVRLALKFLKNKSQKFINRLPIDIKEEIKGLSEGAGISYDSALEVFVFPEIVSYLTNKFANNNYAYKTHLSGAALMGCTSIVAMSEATAKGELIHGRNLDFVGIDYWDKYPIVSYIYPEKGFNYISISSAGLAGGVVTGINEKEITYALHQNYTKEFVDHNLPVLAMGNLIMKYADSLEKAKEIITSSKANSGWSVVISDNKTKRAFVAEICSDQVHIKEADHDLLVYTNSYISKEFHEKEIVISPPLNISSNVRYQRMNQLASKDYYNIEVDSVISYLGDRYDITSEKERIYGYTISQNNTVGSVAFVPDQKSFYVGSGKTPVCNRKYVLFNMDWETNKGILSKILPAKKLSNEKDMKVLDLVMKANSSYESGEHSDALDSLIEASKISHKNEPNIYFLCGILYLKINNYDKAIKFFQTAYDCEQDIYKSGMIKIWLGRVYDILDNREKALKNYRYVEQMDRNIYHDIVDLARKGIKKAYTKRQIKNINPDIWYGEELIIK